jgi:hypothetical protein
MTDSTSLRRAALFLIAYFAALLAMVSGITWLL